MLNYVAATNNTLTEILRQAIGFATRKLPFGASLLNGFIYELLGIAPKEKEDKISPALKEINDKLDTIIKEVAKVEETVKEEAIKSALRSFDVQTDSLLTVTKQFSAEIRELSKMDVDYPPYQIQIYSLYKSIGKVQVEGNGYPNQTLKIGNALLPSQFTSNKGIIELYQGLVSDMDRRIDYQNYLLGVYLQSYGISMLYLNFKYDGEDPVQQAGTKELINQMFEQMKRVEGYMSGHLING